VVQSRIQYQPATRDYVARRTAEGKTGREIKRCLARYVARDGSVSVTVFPARRAEPGVQRERCRDDHDTERHDSQEEARALG
jgi:hypothetical protein